MFRMPYNVDTIPTGMACQYYKSNPLTSANVMFRVCKKITKVELVKPVS